MAGTPPKRIRSNADGTVTGADDVVRDGNTGFPAAETTHGEWKPRHGALYWYPLTPVLEIVVYPLLFGAARLVKGLRTTDRWQVGYDYPDVSSAYRAAEEWDGEGDPGHGWIRKIEGGEGRRTLEAGADE